MSTSFTKVYNMLEESEMEIEELGDKSKIKNDIARKLILSIRDIATEVLNVNTDVDKAKEILDKLI